MPKSKNHYQILQVDSSAEPEIIKAAYKKLAQKYHPDKNTNSDAIINMQAINEAYEVLKDSIKRRQYDIELSSKNIKVTPPVKTENKYRKKPESEVKVTPNEKIQNEVIKKRKFTKKKEYNYKSGFLEHLRWLLEGRNFNDTGKDTRYGTIAAILGHPILAYVTGLLGITFGILALIKIKRFPALYGGKDNAKFGIVAGTIILCIDIFYLGVFFYTSEKRTLIVIVIICLLSLNCVLGSIIYLHIEKNSTKR